MRALSTFLVLVVSALPICLGAPTTSSPYTTKERVPPPRGWTQQGKPSSDHHIVLRIGLPQTNFHILEQHLYQISDPFHERYGQHLSKEQVEDLVAPTPESLAAVEQWLEGFGFSPGDLLRSPAQDWITLSVPVDVAEKMLDTVSDRFNFVVHRTSTDSTSDLSYLGTRRKWRYSSSDD